MSSVGSLAKVLCRVLCRRCPVQGAVQVLCKLLWLLKCGCCVAAVHSAVTCLAKMLCRLLCRLLWVL